MKTALKCSKLIFVLIALAFCSCVGSHTASVSGVDFTIKIGEPIPEELFDNNVWIPFYTNGTKENWFHLYQEEETCGCDGFSIYILNNEVKGLSFLFENGELDSKTKLKLELGNRTIEFYSIKEGEYFDKKLFYSKTKSGNGYRINIYQTTGRNKYLPNNWPQ